MKKLKTCAISALMALFCLVASAQPKGSTPLNQPDYNKPRLFTELPSKMTLRLPALEPALRLKEGASVSLQLTDNFRFEGTIVSMDLQDPALQSIVVRSTNKNGAVLTFTRALNEDKTYSYSGRILSRDSGDAFEIKLENGQYILQKKELYDLMNE